MLVLHALFDRFRQISSNVEILCQFHVREASIVNAEQPALFKTHLAGEQMVDKQTDCDAGESSGDPD
jgi:hypothetical protein